MQSMSTDRFLDDYELKIEREFELNGIAAEWAPGVAGPRFWGEEDANVYLDEQETSPTGRSSDMTSACSPDAKFLAVSLQNRILVYDMETRQLQAEVTGHEGNIEKMYFRMQEPHRAVQGSSTGTSPYLLFVGGERDGWEDSTIVMWQVDASGHFHDDLSPLAVDQMVEAATNAMSTDFARHSDIDESDIQIVRSELQASLKRINYRKRQKQLQVLPGRFPSFGSEPFSKDGSRCIFIGHGTTTQHGMRPDEELPQIIVWDLASSSEVCRLKGHTDAIMWASWAADDQAIVTAAWDETFKIWDAESGQMQHTIGPCGGQCWSGAVSPRGEYVLFSGGQPTQIDIYMVGNGIKTTNVDTSQILGRSSSWIRELTWSPKGDEITITSGRKVFLVDPTSGEIKTIVELEDDGSLLNSFASFRTPQWFDEGRKLVLRGSEKTIFVWDKEKNCKWRFQRRQGVDVPHYNQGVYYLAGKETIVSVDGDLQIRFWKL